MTVHFPFYATPMIPAHTVVLKSNLALVTNAHFAADINSKNSQEKIMFKLETAQFLYLGPYRISIFCVGFKVDESYLTGFLFATLSLNDNLFLRRK